MSDSLLPKPIADERFLALEAVVQARIDALPMSRVWVYLLEHVEAAALPHLARQFGALGPTWSIADEAGRRALLTRVIERRRHRGTPFAVRDALASIGYEVELQSSQAIRYDGSVHYNGQWYYANPTDREYWILIESDELSEQEGASIIDAAGEWGRLKATPVVFWATSLPADLADWMRHGGVSLVELEPFLLSSTPSDEATGVDITAAILLAFDRDVQAGSGTIYLKGFSDDAVIDSWDVATDVAFTGTTAELTLTAPLGVDTQYYIEIASGVIERLSGRAFAGLAKGDLEFTTESELEPLLVSSSPSDGATGVGTATAIQLVFHRDVQAGSGTIYLKRFADDVTIDSWDVSTDVVFTDDTAELTLTAPLDEETQYYIEIASGVIERTTGHAFAGLAKSALDFTTGDFTAPLLVSSIPSDGATDVDTATTIQLVFDEDVQAGSGTIYLKRFADDVTIDSWDVSTDVVFVDDTIEMTLAAPLAGGTQYYIEMAGGAIEDSIGNEYAGLAKGALDFTSVVTDVLALGTNRDASGSATGSGTFQGGTQHTLVDGANRIVRIAVAARHDGSTTPVFNSVTYGGVAATLAVELTWSFARIAIYYVLEADLPADGAHHTVVDYTFGGSNPTYWAMGTSAIKNAAQTAPELTDSSLITGSEGANSCDVTGVSNGAWVLNLWARGTSGNISSWDNGQVVYFDVETFGEFQAAAAELQGANGETSQALSFGSATPDNGLVVASFAKAV